MPTQIQTVHSPAGWRGDELFRREDWQYVLNETDIQALDDALEAVRALPMEQISPDNFSPRNLSDRLFKVRDSLENGSGAFRLRGLPVHRFSEDQIARIFWGIGAHIGTPVSQSSTGERLFHVRDEGYKIGHQRARGPNTSKELAFHTDRCDVIAFCCVKQAKSGGENLLVSSVTVHNEILERRPDLMRLLYEPYYYRRHNVDEGNRFPYCRQPIFAIHEGHFIANILRVLIDRAYALPEVPDMTPAQREALDLVEEIASDSTLNVRFRQAPGDMLFVNNFVVFHKRTAFHDAENAASGRHLFRLWLSVPNSRPLPRAFEDHYRTTAAGAIRGGIYPPSRPCD